MAGMVQDSSTLRGELASLAGVGLRPAGFFYKKRLNYGMGANLVMGWGANLVMGWGRRAKQQSSV